MKDIHIRDLGVIGDRRTAALVTRDASIVWYCPSRFDRPSVFGALLDPQGGAWTIDVPHSHPLTRGYIGDTGILETQIETHRGSLVITDWLTIGDSTPAGALCRVLSSVPVETCVRLRLRPNYNRESVVFKRIGLGAVTQGLMALYASHPLSIDVAAGEASFVIPPRERGWAVLADQTIGQPDWEMIEGWRTATISNWNELSKRVEYRGPYEREVAASLRSLRLLTYEETGGIVAAVTTSLPETIGGKRNYDYRYVWTRDAGMIVSALSRAGSNGIDEGRFLDFICSTRGNVNGMPIGPVAAVDCGIVPVESIVESWAGYRNSQPVNIGNGARDQLQFDALGNVLLAAKLFYEQSGTRPHWPTVCEIADYLAEHWHESDFGIWEEREKHAYTAGKVITACGLEFIAKCTQDRDQSERWNAAASEIRAYVAAHCLTDEGGYAAVAGGQSVDISAALISGLVLYICGFARNDYDNRGYRAHSRNRRRSLPPSSPIGGQLNRGRVSGWNFLDGTVLDHARCDRYPPATSLMRHCDTQTISDYSPRKRTPPPERCSVTFRKASCMPPSSGPFSILKLPRPKFRTPIRILQKGVLQNVQ